MVLLKTSLFFSLLVISCLAVENQINVTPKVDESPKTSVNKSEVLDSIKDKNVTTTPAIPTTSPSSTTSIPTSTSTTAIPNSTTTLKPTSTTSTTPNPNSTTTLKPTTNAPTTPNPNSTTTLSPITTTSPNVTTVAPTPPEPTPARSWDGPSFFGGMVLAFGIVAVGFVGYRFFYLGRGSAYHTL